MLPKSRVRFWLLVAGGLFGGLVTLIVGSVIYTDWLERNYPLIMCAAMPDDATQIHMGLANGKIVVFDLDSNRLRQIRQSIGESRGPVETIACLADGAVCFGTYSQAGILEPTGTTRCRIAVPVGRLASARRGSLVADLPKYEVDGLLSVFHAGACEVAWEKWSSDVGGPSVPKWEIRLADVSSLGNTAALVFGENRSALREAVEIRDASNGILHRSFRLREWFRTKCIALSPSGTGLAVAGFNGSIELRPDWNADEVVELRCPPLRIMRWIGESRVVGVSSSFGHDRHDRIVFGDLATRRTIEVRLAEMEFVRTLQVTPDGKSVVAAAGYNLYVWSPPSFDSEHSQPTLRAVLSTDHLWGDWDTKDLPPEVTKPRRPDGRPL